MKAVLILVITFTGVPEQKILQFESFNDCERAGALVEKYVPGARAYCEWRFEDASRG